MALKKVETEVNKELFGNHRFYAPLRYDLILHIRKYTRFSSVGWMDIYWNVNVLNINMKRYQILKLAFKSNHVQSVKENIHTLNSTDVCCLIYWQQSLKSETTNWW